MCDCVKIFPLCAAIALSGLLGCTTTDPVARGQEISIRYAEVVSVRRVPVPSAAPAGAVVGGFTGLVLGRKQSTAGQIAAGAGGAALGALAARALEGDRRAYEYTLRHRDDRESRFVTEKGFLEVGDCVAVERGEFANVRRVDASKCGGTTRPAISERNFFEAEQCHEAKKQLLAATDTEAVENAAKKVEVLCEF